MWCDSVSAVHWVFLVPLLWVSGKITHLVLLVSEWSYGIMVNELVVGRSNVPIFWAQGFNCQHETHQGSFPLLEELTMSELGSLHQLGSLISVTRSRGVSMWHKQGLFPGFTTYFPHHTNVSPLNVVNWGNILNTRKYIKFMSWVHNQRDLWNSEVNF